jgi:CTP:molybdopterin cytidylyltransferase MocA
MNRRLLVALVSAGTLVAASAALIATAQSKGAVFIAGDQPVTEAQVREKLQSDGYSSIQIARQGNFFEAVGSKEGKPNKVIVDARTGRLADNDGDDDDD